MTSKQEWINNLFCNHNDYIIPWNITKQTTNWTTLPTWQQNLIALIPSRFVLNLELNTL